jgi:hypothetical protein
MLAERFPQLSEMRVLDLGGTEESWRMVPSRPANLLIVNHPDAISEHKKNTHLGDACDPTLLEGERFDLVFSNSVIEHVGGHYRREQFAETVMRLGEHHWIQTPYRYFPIEPHYVCPGLQFLPTTAQVALGRHWPIGSFSKVRAEAVERRRTEWALSIDLLSRTAMRHYFPKSEILSERVAGLAKSLIAVR